LVADDVELRTADGVRLAGWYLPSSNGAAVVLLHGAGSTRSDVLDQALVLQRHGYGVLMIDARGHGASGGRAMDFGWEGDADIAAATRYLATRPEVDGRRIGAVGVSMGGEEAIGASGANDSIRAVVAEGATARVAGDEEWLPAVFGWRGTVQEQLERVQDVVTDVLTSSSVPTSLRSAVMSSGDTRYLLITAGDVGEEARAAAYIATGAPDRVARWTVPGSGHGDGIRAQPAEWEARVVGFLGVALAVP
jgi:pimeloyl-ACP methyl ester carboxylesterase